jgi:hypothetical protein
MKVAIRITYLLIPPAVLGLSVLFYKGLEHFISIPNQGSAHPNFKGILLFDAAVAIVTIPIGFALRLANRKRKRTGKSSGGKKTGER